MDSSVRARIRILALGLAVASWAEALAVPYVHAAPIREAEARIREIPLFMLNRYDPDQSGSFIRAIKSAGSSVLSTTVGTVVLNFMDLKDSLKAKLSEKTEVAGYFSSQERDAIASRIVKKIELQVTGAVTNDEASWAIRFSGSTLIYSIAERALEKEGVSDPEARKAWVRKITNQFDSCGKKARTYFEAQGCVDSAVASIPQNIGLALVHELARQELGPSLRDPAALQALEADLDRNYRRCPFLSSENGAQVKACVTHAMRAGVAAVTHGALRRSLEPHFRGEALERIHASAWQPFQACLGRASDSPSFRRCIDSLVIDAGGAAVQEKGMSEAAVVEAYPDREARDRVAVEGRAVFDKCAHEALKGNLRQNGQLSIEHCQIRAENRITRIVVQRAFRMSVAASLGATDPGIGAVVEKGNRVLERCWADDQDASKRSKCVRVAVIALARAASERNVERDVPAEVFKRDLGFRSRLLSEYESCLHRELPKDIVRSPDRASKLDLCSGDLRRKAALRSAEFKVRAAFGTKLPQADLDALIRGNVHGQFAKCLGPYPAGAKLPGCSVALTRDVAKAAGAILIPAEVRSFFTNTEKPITFEEGRRIDGYLAERIAELNGCLDRNVTPSGSKDADVRTEGCFKDGIGEIVLFVAEVKFEAETSSLYSGDRETERAALRKRLLDEIRDCTAKAKDSDSLDGYLGQVKACAASSGNRVTGTIARDQVEFALLEHLPDEKGGRSRASEREQLRAIVLGSFEGCMSRVPAGSTDGTQACVEGLRRNATREIGISAGRIQVSAQLGSRAERSEISGIEREFRSCVDSAAGGGRLSAELEGCLKSYTLDLAATIGGIKVRNALVENLGSKEYGAVEAQAEAALKRFNACLKAGRSRAMGKEFLGGIEGCVADLRDSARKLVKGTLREWLDVTDAVQAPGALAKALLAASLPCLDALMPDRGAGTMPEQQLKQAGVDPEGTLRALVEMLRNYIDYDAGKADADVAAILAELQHDIAAVGPAEARKRLVKMLVEKGALDQLIKAVVRANVAKALQGLPADQKFSSEITARLLDKATFDAIFEAPEGRHILDKALAGIVWPMLGEGRSLEEPRIAAMQESLKNDVGALLAESSRFGDVLIAASVQKQMQDMNFVSRVMARLIYGSDAMKWEKLRGTESGRAAERYIRDSILRPKMLEQRLSPEEEKRRLEQAKELVTTAVKSYSVATK